MVEVTGLLTECVEAMDPVWITVVVRLSEVFEGVVALMEYLCLVDELVALVGTSLLALGLFVVDVGGTAVVLGQWL